MTEYGAPLTSPRLEIEGNARPRIPSIGSPLNELDRVVTGEKYWFLAVRPATVTGTTWDQKTGKTIRKAELTGIRVHGSRHGGTIAILDGEGAALLRGGRRRGGVEPLLACASAARAGGAGDPQVGRARVEVNEEGLGRGADADRASPLEVVLLVGEGLRAGGALQERGGNLLQVFDHKAFWETSVVLDNVTEVPLVLAARGNWYQQRAHGG